MEQSKLDKANEEIRNKEAGIPGDVDFIRMISKYRAEEMAPPQPHLVPSDPMKICIAVRKRPISSKEVKRFDHDCVSCANPIVTVHDSKLKIDGISK
jgi:kinesin family member 2/24